MVPYYYYYTTINCTIFIIICTHHNWPRQRMADTLNYTIILWTHQYSQCTIVMYVFYHFPPHHSIQNNYTIDWIPYQNKLNFPF